MLDKYFSEHTHPIKEAFVSDFERNRTVTKEDEFLMEYPKVF